MPDTFELQHEVSQISNSESYDIAHEADFDERDPNDLLEAAVETVADRSEAIQEDETFDVYCYFLKHADRMPGVVMGKLLDSISSGMKAELDATFREIDARDQEGYMSHKLVLELYAFLLVWFVRASEKVKTEEGDAPAAGAKSRRGRGGKAAASRTASRTATKKRTETWSWQSQIPDTLKLIIYALRLPALKIWTATPERDAYIDALMRPAERVSESEVFMKSPEIKYLTFEVFCRAAKDHNRGSTLATHVGQSLQFTEHMPETLAECLSILSQKYEYPQTGDEVLRDLAGQTFTQDGKTGRTCARFLVAYTEHYWKGAHRNLVFLMNQQDSESYPMRQAIIEILGILIRKLSDTAEEGEERNKAEGEWNRMFANILERLNDNNSYVRTKVFAVLSRICDAPTKFHAQRLDMANLAVMALEDKIPSVRKSALSLLIKLMETNPYNIGQDRSKGGTLDKEFWEGQMAGLKEKLKKYEAVGNAVDNAEVEGDEEEEAPRKKKRSKRSEDDMDVDGEEGDGNGEAEGEATEEDEPNNLSGDEDGQQRPRKLKPRKSQINVEGVMEEQEAVAHLSKFEYANLIKLKDVATGVLAFVDVLAGAIDTIVKLLGSKSKAEVLEAIEFFKVGFAYRLNDVEDGIRKMIHLIWTKDNNTPTIEEGQQIKGIRQKLLECYKFLYFEKDERLEPKKRIGRIAGNIIRLTYNATLAELTSLEEMLRIMMEDGQVGDDVIAKLWQIYGANKNIPQYQRTGAIIVLGMLGIAKPHAILVPNKDLMLKVGLGKMGKSDLTLARYTCVALQRLNGSAKKVKGSLEDKTIRYPMDDRVFQRILKTIVHPCRSVDWFGLTEQAINTVYALGEHPAEFCDSLIKQLAQRVWNNPRSTKPADGSASATASATQPQADAAPPGTQPMTQFQQGDGGEDVAMDEDNTGDAPEMADQTATHAGISTAPSSGPKHSDDAADAFELAQLMFVVGHVAIKQIVFLELVEREWKRQKEVRQAAEKAATAETEKSKKDKEGDELDQVVGNAEDEIGDRMAAIREMELLFGDNSLLSVFAPMIVQICGSPHKFKNRTLRAACHLSLCKLLCVSSKFTDKHHRLLFKILETSRDPNIRANSVIALGDVAVSFNNIIDENSAELYKGLLDSDPRVKKTTLMVLTHLILNGMIKVKGQLGEMAKCVEDEDERIQDLAKLFFSELATKENAVYNNLPDIISHLSSGANATDEEKFQSTMKYIFTFIEKEKQAEAIVDKLCQRFRLTEDPRQWRDIAFCLSLLPFKSERSVKKLIEGLQFYRDKLHEPKVFEQFQHILDKARQNKSKDKPDAELDEFEKILQEHRSQGEEDQALQNRVAKKAKKRAKATGKGRKKAAPIPEEEEE